MAKHDLFVHPMVPHALQHNRWLAPTHIAFEWFASMSDITLHPATAPEETRTAASHGSPDWLVFSLALLASRARLGFPPSTQTLARAGIFPGRPRLPTQQPWPRPGGSFPGRHRPRLGLHAQRVQLPRGLPQSSGSAG